MKERFLLDDFGKFTSTQDDSYVWWVPLSYTHDFSSHATTAWMGTKNKQLITVSATNDEWLIFNVEQSGNANYNSSFFTFINPRVSRFLSGCLR